jgi:small GTP-binding protein
MMTGRFPEVRAEPPNIPPEGVSANYKIILIGDSDVGKSSIISRYVHNKDHDDCRMMFGTGFGAKYVTFYGELVKLSIWDTAGQEKYRTITKSYYRNVDAVVLVYNLSEPETFDNLKKIWMNELIDNGVTSVPMLLIGNRPDDSEERLVPSESGKAFARQYEALFIEGSRIEQLNEVFGVLVEKIRERKRHLAKREHSSVSLDDGSQAGWCC